ncbi:hypothetical protein ACFQGT_07285 [Natrialbaceae archaeon GCM10025810]|uniref:hypothetical protein n=1 Tax=Halovalidus salilacus TaxID=3075124 RepID=UPI00360649D5
MRENEGDERAPNVGDLVSPVDVDEPAVVMRICDQSAGDYWLNQVDESLATHASCDPDEPVYQVVFPDPSAADLADLPRVPYPRSQLEVVGRIRGRSDGSDEA